MAPRDDQIATPGLARPREAGRRSLTPRAGGLRDLAACLSVLTAAPAISRAQDAAPQDFALHGQATFVDQGNLAFKSPYAGPQSLPGFAEGRETLDVTLFIGFRPWNGGEIWVNPEVDQGFGLADTLGVAGFPSAEAYKVGRADPYVRVPRLFLRQTVDLWGASAKVDPTLNQLAMSQTENRIVLTIGRFAVTDVFDANDYAHDPKHDFLNWTAVDAGTFDYAADAWGYTLGAAAEWYQGGWTLRGGVFDLSKAPNSQALDTRLSQFQLIGEVERRYAVLGKKGAMKVTGFLTRGRMGRYDEAIALGEADSVAPNTANVRRYQSRPGVSLDWQQVLVGDLGAFARAGAAGGQVESFEFTDVDRSLAGGLSLAGKRWGRAEDTVGLAGIDNGISKEHQAYLAAGGLGILVGDGRLPHEGDEHILETYYDIGVGKYAHVALDYQFIENPAYNRDRGPASLFAARLHAQF